MKFGYQGSFQKSAQGRVANSTQLEYRFNNGVPNAVSYYLAAQMDGADRSYGDDVRCSRRIQWTRGRLTLQGGVRYDRAWSWAPAEGNGTSLTSRFNPQPISFARNGQREGYNDITPRIGGAYDLFGNGKTAIKVNLGSTFQAGHQRRELLGETTPPAGIVTSVANRGWTDGNKNFTVDCDLLNPAAQNNWPPVATAVRRRPATALEFRKTANPNLTTVNPAILQGGASVRTTGSSGRQCSSN